MRPGQSGSTFLLRRLDRRGTERIGDIARLVGLYEFTFRDGQWLVGILYQDTVASWQAQHADPLRDVGCGVAPWGAG